MASNDATNGRYRLLSQIEPWPELAPELPPLTAQEFEELQASIREHGQQQAILIDESGRILDGNHRYQALVELGIDRALIDQRIGLSHDAKRALALDLNVARRQLTPEKLAEIREQRRVRVAELRQEGMSYRQIGEELGVSHEQVRKDLGGSESPVNRLTGDEVTGRDDKSYPAEGHAFSDPTWPRRAHDKHREANGSPQLLLYEVVIKPEGEIAYAALFEDAIAVSAELYDEIVTEKFNLEHDGQIEALLFDQDLRNEMRHPASVFVTLLADPRSKKIERVLEAVAGYCDLNRIAEEGSPDPYPPEPEAEAGQPEIVAPESVEVSSDAPVGDSDDNGDNGSKAEWYTPPDIIERVKKLLGGHIGLDPASCDEAQATVQALRYFTKAENGLAQPWSTGTLFLNPPYGSEITDWIAKLVAEYEADQFLMGAVLVAHRSDTPWFQLLRDFPRCHLRGRLKFGGPKANGKGSDFPSVLIGVNVDLDEFAEIFEDLGDIYVRYVREELAQ